MFFLFSLSRSLSFIFLSPSIKSFCFNSSSILFFCASNTASLFFTSSSPLIYSTAESSSLQWCPLFSSITVANCLLPCLSMCSIILVPCSCSHTVIATCPSVELFATYFAVRTLVFWFHFPTKLPKFYSFRCSFKGISKESVSWFLILNLFIFITLNFAYY